MSVRYNDQHLTISKSVSDWTDIVLACILVSKEDGMNTKRNDDFFRIAAEIASELGSFANGFLEKED